MKKIDIAGNILRFLHIIERLKNECRHSWTSEGRQESVAEHSWRLALMVIICSPYLKNEFDLLKAIKLALIHDLGESIIGDMHYLDIVNDTDLKMKRHLDENEAIKDLSQILGENGGIILELWNEFENRSSYEANIVFALDKLEACIQHNEADISTWTEKEKATLEAYFKDIPESDNFLLNLKEAIKLESFIKINNSFIE